MSLLEGIDYTVRCLPFPNYASEALVLSAGDGSYQILLNSRYPEEVLRARLEHELSHLRADHLYQSERPIAEREAEAEGRPAPPAPPAGTTLCRPPDGCEPSLQNSAPCPSPWGEGGAQRRMRGSPAPTPSQFRAQVDPDPVGAAALGGPDPRPPLADGAGGSGEPPLHQPPAPYRPAGGGYFASWGRALAWARAQMANSGY